VSEPQASVRKLVPDAAKHEACKDLDKYQPQGKKNGEIRKANKQRTSDE
jgi:hypothetical protein